MSWITGLAIYFIIWWTVLFAILPIGMRSQAEDEDIVLGTAHSAPTVHRIGQKALLTTLVSAAIFGLYYLVTQVYGWGVDDLPHIIPGT